MIYIRYEGGKNLVGICTMLKIVEKAPANLSKVHLINTPRTGLSKAAETITSIRGLSLLQSAKIAIK